MNTKKLNFWIVLCIWTIASVFCTTLVCNYIYDIRDSKTVINPPPSATDPGSDLIITIETLESGIREIKQLNTAQYYFSTKQDVSNVKTIEDVIPFIRLKYEIPGTGKSFSYKYDGHVNGSIDFSKAKVSKEKNTIYIVLPKATASDVVLDSPCEFFEINNNILNPISPEEMMISEEMLKETELNNAIQKGLLVDAEKNAKTVILDFLKLFKKELKDFAVEVSFE